MPNIQTIDTSPNKGEPSIFEKTVASFVNRNAEHRESDALAEIYQQYQQDGENINSAIEQLHRNPNIGPTARVSAMNQLNKFKDQNIALQKAAKSSSYLTPEDREEKKEQLIADGMPDYEAELYLDSPKGVQGRIWAAHQERKDRKKRIPVGEGGTPQAPQPVNSQPGVESNIPEAQGALPTSNAAPAPVIQASEDYPIIAQPANRTDKELVKWEDTNQKENNALIKETQDKKKELASTGRIISSMRTINDSKKIPNDLGRAIIDPSTGDIRPEAQWLKLVNPETALYVKNLKQFLKGAKGFFGSVISDFDIQNFMAQLPSLLNDEDGRRLILNQMELTNQLEEVYNNELNSALKHYGRNANYSDVQKVVDARVKAKEAGLIDKLNNVISASKFQGERLKNPEQFKGTVLMQNPKTGKFKSVPVDKVPQALSKQWRQY